jgi:glutathione synthase/RimK-type ligase-like ATP-grasp enzyme
MANLFAPIVPKPKIALLRRKDLGNNCHYISDAFPGMSIMLADEIPEDMDWIVRWGTITKTGAPRAKVINRAGAIKFTSNKGAFRLLANAHGLTPRTWASIEALQMETDVGAVVVRPMHHERSEGVFVCSTLPELELAIEKCEGEYYISDYVEKTQEFRVFVAQGRAFMVYEKTPKDKNDISWGCVEEGSLKYVGWSKWPNFVVENAIKAFNLSKLDFGAVDVMVKDGKAYFLEINTAPEVWSYYGKKFAEVFAYMIEHGKDRIEVTDWTNWKALIHPAITVKAV